MSFRRVGGLNYSSKHNYVSSSNNATGNLLISENVGLLNTCIHFESDIDASFCGSTGSSGSGATGPTGSAGPTGLAGPTGPAGGGTPSLPNTSSNLGAITISAGGFPNSAVFPQTLNIPSAGKYLLNALVHIDILGTLLSATTSGGWSVSFVGPVAGAVKTSMVQSITINNPTPNQSIIFDTNPTGLVVFDNTLIYPYSVQVELIIYSSSFGAYAYASASAIRVADL